MSQSCRSRCWREGDLIFKEGEGVKIDIDDALNWLVVMSVVPLIPVRFVPLHDLFSDCDSIVLLLK